MKALCLGSAACMAADLEAARALGIAPDLGWTLIAVNTAAMTWPGALPHWASFHGENFPRWVSKRHELRLPPAETLWSAERRVVPPNMGIRLVANWGGSSGLLAVTVAMALGCERIVLCGIPLDIYQGHFDQQDRIWHDGGNYRAAWERQIDAMGGKVRSVSGWTAKLLGMPDADWLAESATL